AGELEAATAQRTTARPAAAARPKPSQLRAARPAKRARAVPRTTAPRVSSPPPVRSVAGQPAPTTTRSTAITARRVASARPGARQRSEERRVGKECRARGGAEAEKKKKERGRAWGG